MSLLARCKSVIAAAFLRTRMERDIEVELQFHVTRYTESRLRRRRGPFPTGMPTG